jgi:putative nucleotidyltransferase with HDIG domain
MAIKKIGVAELCIGMYLHGFDCPWMDNPFWRNKFLLTHGDDLQKARQSGIEYCWIDTARGDDVAAPPAPAPPAPAPSAVAAPAAQPAAAIFSDELRRAASVCDAARDATVTMFGEARLGNAIDTGQCEALVNEIADSVWRNPGALISLARLKTSDNYTYMHSVAVCALMISLGRALQLSEAQCREAGLAGLLHDIGKMAIPHAILNHPGKLSDAEFAVVKSHPERGHDMLRQSGSLSAAVLDVCLHHHEKIDGSGYPHRLEGEHISLLARMGAVCDVYDAITSNRPYKAGWDPAESLNKMIAWKGHFDTKVLSAFIQVIGIYPSGALVRLRSNRLAVVIEQNSAQFTKPVVKVFYCLNKQQQLAPLTLDLALPATRDAIVAREPRGNWDAAVLDALWAGSP